MSELMQGTPAYEPPEGFRLGEHFHDREVPYGKKLLLYIGEKATADIVERKIVGSQEAIGALILRLETTTDKSMDLFRHPQSYLSAEEAVRVFEKVAPTEEEIDQMVGLKNAA